MGFATLDHTDAAVGPLTRGRNQSVCLLSGRYFSVQEGSKMGQFLNTEKKMVTATGMLVFEFNGLPFQSW